MQYFSVVSICLPWDSCLWYGQYLHLYSWLVSWPVCFFSFICEFGICHLVSSSSLSSSSSFSFFFFIAFLLKLFVVDCNISYLNLLLWIVFWIIVSYFLLFRYLGWLACLFAVTVTRVGWQERSGILLSIYVGFLVHGKHQLTSVNDSCVQKIDFWVRFFSFPLPDRIYVWYSLMSLSSIICNGYIISMPQVIYVVVFVQNVI
jgi:hypothetical protein